MTEREKMQAGMLYDANNDEELCHSRNVCHDLCAEYNRMKNVCDWERRLFMTNLFEQLGENAEIVPPFWCDYGHNIRAGKNLFVNFNCVILDEAKVTFGDYVFVSPNCGFYTAGHPMDAGRRNQGLEYARPITVGSDVWIGANTCVLPGVTIGSNVVIGAGSVVNRDIPDNSFAAGVPCRVIRTLTKEDTKRASTGSLHNVTE